MENALPKPFVDTHFTLLKSAEKGGWTYVMIPLDGLVQTTRFGMRKVNGFIDGYELKDFTMWSIKNKGHFVSVKAEIRKKIGKEAGDNIKLQLFWTNLPDVAEDDFLLCLKEEPGAYELFTALPPKKQKDISSWVLSAGTEDSKVSRIAGAIDRIMAGFEKW